MLYTAHINLYFTSRMAEIILFLSSLFFNFLNLAHMYIVSVFFKAGLIYCTAFISLFNHNSKFSLFNNFELCCFNHSGNIIYLILGSLSEYSFFLIVS